MKTRLLMQTAFITFVFAIFNMNYASAQKHPLDPPTKGFPVSCEFENGEQAAVQDISKSLSYIGGPDYFGNWIMYYRPEVKILKNAANKPYGTRASIVVRTKYNNSVSGGWESAPAITAEFEDTFFQGMGLKLDHWLEIFICDGQGHKAGEATLTVGSGSVEGSEDTVFQGNCSKTDLLVIQKLFEIECRGQK
jgi:hypothetical protein